MQQYSIRLSNSNSESLKKDVKAIAETKGITVHVAGYENWSMKRNKATLPHAHVLVSMAEDKIKLNRRCNALGYKGGLGEMGYNVSRRDEELEKSERYHCKGNIKGQYEVEYIDGVQAQLRHADYHMIAAKAHSTREKKKPLYLRIVEDIIANLDEYYGRKQEDGSIALSRRKIIRRIMSSYAEADLWFKSDAIEKTYNLLSAKIDIGSILNANEVRVENMHVIYINNGTEHAEEAEEP